MIKIETEGTKLIFHPERVAEWKKTGDCFPIYAEIGLTNRCNHRCIFCALDFIEHKGADINKKVMLSALEDMASHGVKSVMFAGEGEPLLHKDISEFAEAAKKSGMDVYMTTNGVFFSEEKAEKILPQLTWIRFSVDAGTPENYALVHQTKPEDFEKVMRNIQEAAELRNKNNYPATVGVQALITKQSLGGILTLAQKLKEIGADNLQVKPYSRHPLSRNDLKFDYSRAKNIKDQLESMSSEKFQIKYRAETIEFLGKARGYSQCRGLSFFALIDARGNVIPCNLFYGNPEFTYGNLYEKSFSEIWKSEKRKEVTGKLKEMGVEKCREACRLHPTNQYLERLINPHPHDNSV